MGDRSCAFLMPTGLACRSAPLHDRPFCFLHDPEQAEKAAEARRLGGARRRHESTLEVVYGLDGLDSIAGIRRLLQIAMADALALDAGIGRVRLLTSGALAAMKLFEIGNLALRVDALEAASRRERLAQPPRRGGNSLLDEPAS
jgi:hypothetical protein